VFGAPVGEVERDAPGPVAGGVLRRSCGAAGPFGLLDDNVGEGAVGSAGFAVGFDAIGGGGCVLFDWGFF